MKLLDTMQQEGVIKFHSTWRKGPALPIALVAELLDWRARLYACGLIGASSEGVGYGNISRRESSDFIISGSGTGVQASLGPQHFTRVTAVDIVNNSLECEGPIEASSESLTHAAVYACDPEIRAVIHVHSAPLWHKYLNALPTTDPQAAYGTPAMALAVQRLLRDGPSRAQGIIIMAGHEEGILAFGATLAHAGERLLRYSSAPQT